MFLLWFEAAILLSALVAVLMPTSWMEQLHGALELGALPHSTIVEYLTRSISLVYASWAPLHIYLARDVRRHADLIAFLAWVKVVFGVGLLALDLTLKMPAFWTICEGPLIIGLSLLVVRLARS